MKYIILSMGSRVCGSVRGPFFTSHPPNLIGLGPIVFLIKIYCGLHLKNFEFFESAVHCWSKPCYTCIHCIANAGGHSTYLFSFAWSSIFTQHFVYILFEVSTQLS